MFIFDEEKNKNMFAAARTYADLLAANAAFLRGELPYTPYHLGPLDAETHPLREALLTLHARGFLSVCGQPATADQRSFVEGYLPIEWVAPWIRYYETHLQTEFVCTLYAFQHRSTSSCCLWGETDPIRTVRTYNTFPRKNYVVSKGTTSIPADVYPPHPGDDFHGYPQAIAVLVGKTVKLVLAHRVFGQGSVEAALLAFFDAVDA